jgi:DNA-binding beta-propeller fold protein YncE
MKKQWLVLLSTCVAIGAGFAVSARCASNPPMKLIQKIPVPGDEGGNFDHFAVDIKTNRLFSCDEGHHTVEVFDMGTNKHIKTIGQGVIQEPHSLLYREDLNRLYVVDGTREIGAVRIFDGKNYNLIKSIDLPPLADWSGYDPATKYLYVNGNGAVVKKPDSTVSIIDTTTGELASQFNVDDNVITGFPMETTNSNMYIGMRTKNVMAVVDRKTRKVVATWPLTLGKLMGAMVLDPVNHRLAVNCRSGQLDIFDTQTGKEVQALPINLYTDGINWDPEARRLYVIGSGPKEGGHPSIEVFQQIDPNHYKSIGEVTTEFGAQTGILVPERHRYYAAAPQHGDHKQQILVYDVP